MLSDSLPTIEAYAKVALGEYLIHRDKANAPQFQTHLYQLTLLDNHEALRTKIEIAAQKAGKKLREEFSAGSDFYSLFLKRDKKELEALILKKAKRYLSFFRHKKREQIAPFFVIFC